MSDTMKPEMQLLSKADVMREYGYPKHQLDKDIKEGSIPAFHSNGNVSDPGWMTGRYYIPRKGVEDRIAALSAKAGKENR